MRKKLIIAICILTCLNFFFLPFLFATPTNSFVEVLAVSFTAMGSIATLITFVIALFLFQKFGLESKFIERKSDVVLELVDLLKGKLITVKTDKFHYYLRTDKDNVELYSDHEIYELIFPKIMIVRWDDYSKSMGQILELKKSYWLPNEIKEKLKFLEIPMSLKIENPLNTKYGRFDYGNESDDAWSLPHPELTVKEYILKNNELVDSIEKWLNEHCDIKIHLNLREGNPQR